MKTGHINLLFNKFPLGLAILTIICGSIVVIGAVFNISSLTKILPFFLPMKIKAAICFILIGSAIILSNYLPNTLNSKITTTACYLARFFAILAGGLSLLTVLQYAFNLDFGIDKLFFHQESTKEIISNARILRLDAAFLARIKLEAAFCYVLLSIATLLICSHNDYARIISASIGTLVLALALASLSSFFTPELGQFGWFGYGIMRMNAAILFVLLWIAIILLSWQKDISSWTLSKSHTLLFFSSLIILVVIGFNSNRIQYWLNYTNGHC